MDEILASIRRIISEDESAEGDHQGGPASHRDEPDTDVLVLTDRIPPDASSPHDPFHHELDDDHAADHGPSSDGSSVNGALAGETEFTASPDPSPSGSPSPPSMPPATHPAPEAMAPLPRDALVVERHSAAEASRVFERFYLMVENTPPKPSPAVVSGGPTLEELTRDLLRPMIAAWLDENLADIVRARVDEEVDRIARGRVR